MSIFALAGKPASKQIAALETGLPSSSLTEIAARFGMSKQLIVESLRFARRTVTQREKAGTRFSLSESERLFRLVRLHRIAREVFTTDHAVAEWLNTPDRSLGMKKPIDLLTTDIGAAKVENLALAMIHGVPV